MRKLRLALGMSNDGRLTKKHFGDSDYYLIVDIYESGKLETIEKRRNTTLDIEEDHEEHHGDPKKFRAVVELLKDVDVMVFYAAGPNYLRIKKNSHLVPFHVNTFDPNEALDLVKANFDTLYRESRDKRKLFNEMNPNG